MSVTDTKHSTFPGKNNGLGRLKVYHISLQLRELAQLVLRGAGVLESTASAGSRESRPKPRQQQARLRDVGPERGRGSRVVVPPASTASGAASGRPKADEKAQGTASAALTR